MEKISVIIPTFNRFQYLMNTIASVRQQTYQNIEIIVVNDCSTDPAYCAFDWEKNGIIIVHLKENSRELFGFPCVGYVRNRGIDVSTGEYIAFCDDDDIWFPNKLMLQVYAMRKSGCKMSSTDGLIGNGPYNPKKRYKRYNAEYYFYSLRRIFHKKGLNFLNRGFPDIFTLPFIRVYNTMICSSVIIEKSLLMKIDKFQCLQIGKEDYDCWLRILEHTNSVYVKQPCFYYDNRHGDGQNY